MFELGQRLNTTVHKRFNASSKFDCGFHCYDNTCCRSVNFRNIPSEDGRENCELLHAVGREEPGNLQQNETYDYFIMVQPERVSGVHKRLSYMTNHMITCFEDACLMIIYNLRTFMSAVKTAEGTTLDSLIRLLKKWYLDTLSESIYCFTTPNKHRIFADYLLILSTSSHSIVCACRAKVVEFVTRLLRKV